MNLSFDESLAASYHSVQQKIRIMSESWVENNIFCPCCGNPHIAKQKNNKPVADFQCASCFNVFELKSKNGNIGRKIADGAYNTMIERITSTANPNLLVLSYSEKYEVQNLTVIPKFFFVPEIIEKRKPLTDAAQRHGWTSCNILLSEVPRQGRISVIANQQVSEISAGVKEYQHIALLQTNNLESRGWLFDVLNCVNKIRQTQFTLNEVYSFTEEMQRKHPHNHNIEAKIRQQLQILRDKGFVEFDGKGKYRKLT